MFQSISEPRELYMILSRHMNHTHLVIKNDIFAGVLACAIQYRLKILRTSVITVCFTLHRHISY